MKLVHFFVRSFTFFMTFFVVKTRVFGLFFEKNEVSQFYEIIKRKRGTMRPVSQKLVSAFFFVCTEKMKPMKPILQKYETMKRKSETMKPIWTRDLLACFM